MAQFVADDSRGRVPINSAGDSSNAEAAAAAFRQGKLTATIFTWRRESGPPKRTPLAGPISPMP
jgi:hypothetical protein